MTIPASIQTHFQGIARNRLLLRLWQSGRELFHSNMLAFLIEHEDYQDAVLGYLWCQNESAKWSTRFHVRVLREFQNVDLWVIALPKLPPDPANNTPLTPDMDDYWLHWHTLGVSQYPWRLFVIENKFKSVPYAAQLKRYEDKLPILRPRNGKMRHAQSLFSLKDQWQSMDTGQNVAGIGLPATPSVAKRVYADYDPCLVVLQPTGTIASIGRWHVKTWEGIAKTMQKLLSQRNTSHGIESESVSENNQDESCEICFVTSYTQLLLHACALHKAVRDQIINHTFCSGNPIQELARRFKLHDFVDKWRYAWLAEEVEDYLRRHYHAKGSTLLAGNRAFDGLEFQYSPSPALSKYYWIEVNAFFSRGTGGIDICLRCYSNPDFALGIQLQANTLKLFVIQGAPSASATPNARANAFSMIQKAASGTGLVLNSKSGLDLFKYDQAVFLLSHATSTSGTTLPQALKRVNAGSFIYDKWEIWNADCTPFVPSNDAGQNSGRASIVEGPDWSSNNLNKLVDTLGSLLDQILANDPF